MKRNTNYLIIIGIIQIFIIVIVFVIFFFLVRGSMSVISEIMNRTFNNKRNLETCTMNRIKSILSNAEM